MNEFCGTGVALVTPFDKEGSVDFSALEKLVEFTIENGVDYLVVQGTTGESATLSQEEKRGILDFIIEVNKGRVPIVLGHGGNNTFSLIEGFANFDFSNINGILSVTPYYNKPTQAGLYNHFRAIAEISPVPVILYNVPGRTSVNMAAETTLALAHDCDNIVAVKEASGDLIQIGKIINDRPEGFAVLSGDDALTLPTISLGGEGAISVTANAFPLEFGNMVRYAIEGDFERSQELHYNLFEIMDLLFHEGNPSGVKAALENKAICLRNVRLPLVEASANLTGAIEEAIRVLESSAIEV